VNESGHGSDTTGARERGACREHASVPRVLRFTSPRWRVPGLMMAARQELQLMQRTLMAQLRNNAGRIACKTRRPCMKRSILRI
jgi:hypothetical protein